MGPEALRLVQRTGALAEGHENKVPALDWATPLQLMVESNISNPLSLPRRIALDVVK
jgi:hypothetical protein